MGISYRIAVPDDAYELSVIESNIFSFPHSEEQFKFEINNEHYIYYLALDNDKIVGYAGLQFIIDEGYITNVAVIESYRGNNISKVLMDMIISYGSDLQLKFISLEVRESNSAAINLYSNNNFKVVSTLRSYYKEPLEDALIMTMEY